MWKNIFLLTFTAYLATCRLIYAFAVIRHGVKYSFDDFLPSLMPKQLGAELAPTGLRQLYNLGTYFREDYINRQRFLPEHFDGSIQPFSSSLQRTQLSAYAFLYGLYPLQQGEKVTTKVSRDLLDPPYERLFPNQLFTEPTHSKSALRQGFSPIPVHSLDYILDSCQNIQLLEKKRNLELADVKSKLYEQHSILIEKMKLTFNFSSELNSVDLIMNFYKYLETAYYIGTPLPVNITLEDNFQLKFIYQYYTTLYNQGQFGRIITTLPVQFMRAKLTQSTSGQNHKKMSLVICHSSSLWPIMVNLNLTSSACINEKRKNMTIADNQNCEIPYYASSLVIQVHEDNHTFKQLVKIKFNGKYMKLCESPHQKCPLQEFLLRLERAQQDYDEYCGPRAEKGYITTKV